MQRTKIKRNKKQHRLRKARRTKKRMHRSCGGTRTEKQKQEQEQLDALSEYLTGFNYAAINGYLRGNSEISPEEQSNAIKVVEQLDKFFEEDERIKINDESFQVYRGLMKKKDLTHLDFIGLQKSYLSTSQELGFVLDTYAGGYIMFLDVQPGVPYLDVESTGLEQTSESEILFPRGVHINLIRMTDNGTKENTKLFNNYKCSVLYCTITKDHK